MSTEQEAPKGAPKAVPAEDASKKRAPAAAAAGDAADASAAKKMKGDKWVTLSDGRVVSSNVRNHVNPLSRHFNVPVKAPSVPWAEIYEVGGRSPLPPQTALPPSPTRRRQPLTHCLLNCLLPAGHDQADHHGRRVCKGPFLPGGGEAVSSLQLARAGDPRGADRPGEHVADQGEDPEPALRRRQRLRRHEGPARIAAEGDPAV